MKLLFIILLLPFLIVLSIPCLRQTSVMYLPPNGKTLYTKYMQGDLKSQVPKDLQLNTPLVASKAFFPNGNYVVGGVLKSDNDDFNTIFFWVFNKNGTQYPGWAIDVSDYEDFLFDQLNFEVEGCEYNLKIDEQKADF